MARQYLQMCLLLRRGLRCLYRGTLYLDAIADDGKGNAFMKHFKVDATNMKSLDFSRAKECGADEGQNLPNLLDA